MYPVKPDKLLTHTLSGTEYEIAMLGYGMMVKIMNIAKTPERARNDLPS
jgi:hypothetical protein